jgi:hypothetical protein
MDLIKRLANFSQKPEYGTDDYKTWVEQDDFVDFLQTLPLLKDIILYASFPYTFVYSLLVPSTAVNSLDVSDLDNWNCDPSSSWGFAVSYGKRPKIWLSPPLDHTGSKTLDRGEKILFTRDFDGRQDEKFYIELSQKLTHAFGLHYVPERSSFCRFDERGDVEDVVRILCKYGQSGDEEGRVVTILSSTLNEYMTITAQTLVLLYDSTRFELKKFSGWRSQERTYRKVDPEIYFQIERNSGEASFLRGFQIIRSSMSKKEVIGRHEFGKLQKRQYATFIAHDWKHDKVDECSCDPKRLGNYFVQSDLPYGTSPVFFRPEVLLKYKADTDKYQVGHRSITCKHAWHLQTYDVNEAGQVHTYLIYLSYLPYEEQLYWKSFNEEPKGPISRRAIQTDFKGEWDQEYDPLRSLIHFLQKLTDEKVSWWILRDKGLIKQAHYPVTRSADEWGEELHTLDKLLIEGFVVSDLRLRLISLGGNVDPQWKSIKLIEEILGLTSTEDQLKEIVTPLKELNSLRSKVSGHATGKEAKEIKANIIKKHKTFYSHFRQLCTRCDRAFRALQTLLLR